MWPNLRPVLIATSLALTGCIPIPVMQEAPFQEDVLAPLAPGKSTRVDVLFTLGEPHMVSADEKLFVYWANQLHAALIFGGYGGVAALPISTWHYLVIEFTPESKVAKFETVTRSVEDYCTVEGYCLTASASPASPDIRLATPADDEEAKAFVADPALCTVYLYRDYPRGGADFAIAVDGRASGWISPLTYRRWQLPPGRHEIRVEDLDQTRRSFECATGEIVFVRLTTSIWELVRAKLFIVDAEAGRAGVRKGRLLVELE